jgi:hypothetical protein
MARNWARIGKAWFPIATLPSVGPVLLTDETQTIQWLADKPSANAVTHKAHKRDEESGQFVWKDKQSKREMLAIHIPPVNTPDVEPVIEESKVEPAYWCFAEYVS